MIVVVIVVKRCVLPARSVRFKALLLDTKFYPTDSFEADSDACPDPIVGFPPPVHFLEFTFPKVHFPLAAVGGKAGIEYHRVLVWKFSKRKKTAEWIVLQRRGCDERRLRGQADLDRTRFLINTASSVSE